MSTFGIFFRFRNRDQVLKLANGIREKGRTCYTCNDWPAHPDMAEADPETQMQHMESIKDFFILIRNFSIYSNAT